MKMKIYGASADLYDRQKDMEARKRYNEISKALKENPDNVDLQEQLSDAFAEVMRLAVRIY